MRLNVGLFNDSFPPTLNGVSTAVLCYARIIQDCLGSSAVVTPSYPHVVDDYPFDVVRYPSIRTTGRIGFRAGNPLSPIQIRALRAKQFDIMHVHSPFSSALLAKQLLTRRQRVPIVMTYHTKYDVDIDTRFSNPQVRKVSKRFILHNLSYANEMWAVSRGAGESLRALGFKGGYRVMRNGTDFPHEPAPREAVDEITRMYNLREDVPVLLFIGRMQWYKNIKLMVDSLALLKKAGQPFHMLFVGDGYDRPSIEQYVHLTDMQDRTTFTGTVYDRERLRAFYTRADLFLFPSTYDTSGLVVMEAASCDCPSLLVRGACAAEEVEGDVTGLLCDENTESCAATIAAALQNMDRLREIGKRAGERVYVSWESAVHAAYKRYEEIVADWPHDLPYRHMTQG